MDGAERTRKFWFYKASRWPETALSNCSKLNVHKTDRECVQHPFRNFPRGALFLGLLVNIGGGELNIPLATAVFFIEGDEHPKPPILLLLGEDRV